MFFQNSSFYQTLIIRFRAPINQSLPNLYNIHINKYLLDFEQIGVSSFYKIDRI